MENKLLEDVYIEIKGKTIKLNTIGLMKVGNDEVLVVGDCPELKIGPNEYQVFLLKRGNDGQVAIKDFQSDALRNMMCDIWEERLQEEQSNDS